MLNCIHSLSYRFNRIVAFSLVDGMLCTITGLNMLNQAREFNEYVGLTGLILTKLDGTARGGAVVSVVDELNVPVKFVGVGEGLDDLQPFNPDAFVDALLPDKSVAIPNT